MKKIICTFMCAVIAITFIPFISLAEETDQSEYPSPVITTETQGEETQIPDVEKTEEELQLEKIQAEKDAHKKTVPTIARIKAWRDGEIEIAFNPLKKKNVVAYKIQRSTNKNFKKNIRNYTKRKWDDIVLFYNGKHLKKGTKYYFRIRAVVKLSDGTTYDCPWSKVKGIKCKLSR